jgi:hypothetical protein
MMIKERFDYANKRPEIKLQYGIDLDETSCQILFVLQQDQKAGFAKQAIAINEIVNKCNSGSSSLALDKEHPRWQAFWFGFGKLGFAICFAVFFALLIYCYQYDQDKQLGKLAATIQQYQNFEAQMEKRYPRVVSEFWRNNPKP